jgi:hypothetical protein
MAAVFQSGIQPFNIKPILSSPCLTIIKIMAINCHKITFTVTDCFHLSIGPRNFLNILLHMVGTILSGSAMPIQSHLVNVQYLKSFQFVASTMESSS